MVYPSLSGPDEATAAANAADYLVTISNQLESFRVSPYFVNSSIPAVPVEDSQSTYDSEVFGIQAIGLLWWISLLLGIAGALLCIAVLGFQTQRRRRHKLLGEPRGRVKVLAGSMIERRLLTLSSAQWPRVFLIGSTIAFLIGLGILLYSQGSGQLIPVALAFLLPALWYLGAALLYMICGLPGAQPFCDAYDVPHYRCPHPIEFEVLLGAFITGIDYSELEGVVPCLGDLPRNEDTGWTSSSLVFEILHRAALMEPRRLYDTFFNPAHSVKPFSGLLGRIYQCRGHAGIATTLYCLLTCLSTAPLKTVWIDRVEPPCGVVGQWLIAIFPMFFSSKWNVSRVALSQQDVIELASHMYTRCYAFSLSHATVHGQRYFRTLAPYMRDQRLDDGLEEMELACGKLFSTFWPSLPHSDPVELASGKNQSKIIQEHSLMI